MKASKSKHKWWRGCLFYEAEGQIIQTAERGNPRVQYKSRGEKNQQQQKKPKEDLNKHQNQKNQTKHNTTFQELEW